jgi:hypothetical protein
VSGFLGHLVQRSLTNRTGVSPRPVSRFEPPRPLPAHYAPQAALFEREGSAIAGDHIRADRRFASAVDPVSRTAMAAVAVSARVRADSPAEVEERSAAMTWPRSDPLPGLNGDSLRGTTQERPRPEARDDSAPTVNLTESNSYTPAARYTAQTATRFVGEYAPRPPAAEPDRRGAPACEALQACEQPPVPQRLLGESPGHAVKEPDAVDSVIVIGPRRFQLQGKLAGQPCSEPSGTRAETPLAVQERLTAPAVPVRTVRGESPDRAEAGEYELQVNTSRPDPVHSVPRDAPSAPAQAILTPRLSREPVAPPAPPSFSKPAEPVVHVTIGRVEIRAVSVPAASKRSSPSKPALSLSDYLSRRSGVRR